MRMAPHSGVGGGDTQAQEAHGCAGEHAHHHIGGGKNHRRADHVGQQVAEQNPRVGKTGHTGGLNKLRILEHQHFAAHQLGIAHPSHQPQGDEEVDESLAQDGHNGDDQDGEGEGHHDVGNTHEQAVQYAAVIAGQQADHAADQEGDHHAQHADKQVNTGTPHHPGEDIPPVEIGAEPMLCAGGLIGDGDIGGNGIIGRNQLGKKGEHHHQNDNGHPHHKRGANQPGGHHPFLLQGADAVITFHVYPPFYRLTLGSRKE